MALDALAMFSTQGLCVCVFMFVCMCVCVCVCTLLPVALLNVSAHQHLNGALRLGDPI